MKVFHNFNLTDYNSYKVKSFCKTAYFPETEEDLIELYKKKEAFILIGSGHNIILSKEYYEEPFVIFNGNYNDIFIEKETNTISVLAGATMLEVSNFALKHELSGVEIFYDIPSSVGGAVVMNAGASGEEIKDILTKVRYLDLEDFKVKEILNSNIDFEYRNSFFQKNKDKIVLKAWLKLEPSTEEKIFFKMGDIKAKRWQKQPKNYPNAGSVFKRPKGFYVGAMIDELNLKGFTKGGAKISEKHGGFIINFDNATGTDILYIIKEVKKRVLDKFGVDLEVEQRVI